MSLLYTVNNMTLGERFSGLILDRDTGRVVGTKLASVTGHLLMSVFFCYHNYKHGFNGEQWMIYGTIIAGHKTAEKLIGLKWGGNNASSSNKSNSN